MKSTDSSEIIRNLKEQVGNLNKTIEDLNGKLKESENMKSNFISNVMNEIYNPFSSILSLSQNIISLDSNNLPKAISLAETIFDEASTLDFDLKNIFAAARIESGLETPIIKKINFNNLINDVVETCQYLAIKKKIEVVISKNIHEEMFSCKSDTDFLFQVIVNVLNNAIKFGPENSIVEIDFSISEKEIELQIKDQGPGIKLDDKLRIFDRFKKLDASVNSINCGYGLGLSVAQALLEMLGGSINSLDDIETGCIISIIIPQSEISNLDDDNNDIVIFDADEETF
ncbi:MAG: HAMP domain-containing sensor histidine kinase [Bacteroidota bacterium]|nr:HAMP domain-containing sensor histidine kinase [Bacteroidota bacterium]